MVCKNERLPIRQLVNGNEPSHIVFENEHITCLLDHDPINEESYIKNKYGATRFSINYDKDKIMYLGRFILIFLLCYTSSIMSAHSSSQM